MIVENIRVERFVPLGIFALKHHHTLCPPLPGDDDLDDNDYDGGADVDDNCDDDDDGFGCDSGVDGSVMLVLNDFSP